MDVGVVELVKLIGNYGIGVICLAVLIVLHLYNVKVALPTITENARKDLYNTLSSFKEDLEKERESSSATIQALTASFRDALEKERTISTTIQQAIMVSFKEELKAERDQCHQDHERMMISLQESRVQITQLTEKQEHIWRTLQSIQGQRKHPNA